jgi:hypothetical protein
MQAYFATRVRIMMQHVVSVISDSLLTLLIGITRTFRPRTGHEGREGGVYV